jgi:hypothetical protein
LVASLDVSQNLKHQQTQRQSHCASSQHQRYSGKMLMCYEPIEDTSTQENENSDGETN